jgi:hypothetical protein
MKGIQFVIDERGEKKAVLIDLKKNKALWEDFFDRALAEQRAREPRESFDEVRRKLFG